jgi:hypothetical protein
MSDETAFFVAMPPDAFSEFADHPSPEADPAPASAARIVETDERAGRFFSSFG